MSAAYLQAAGEANIPSLSQIKCCLLYTSLAVVLFATAKTWKNVVFYYICSIIFMFALIMGQSDNAYLSVAAIYGFTPLYLFKDHRGIRRYAISAASFFTVIQCIDSINQNFADHVYGITGVFKVCLLYTSNRIL